MDIEITNSQNHLPIDPDLLIGLACRVLLGEDVGSASISIALVDDATIHALNRRHLDHDWPTDVITFPLSAPDDSILEAELVISAEMAATTARAAGTDPSDELALYLVHGLLHLCGFDDRDEEHAVRMRRREADILAGEGLSNTFASLGAATAEPREQGSARCRA